MKGEIAPYQTCARREFCGSPPVSVAPEIPQHRISHEVMGYLTQYQLEKRVGGLIIDTVREPPANPNRKNVGAILNRLENLGYSVLYLNLTLKVDDRHDDRQIKIDSENDDGIITLLKGCPDGEYLSVRIGLRASEEYPVTSISLERLRDGGKLKPRFIYRIEPGEEGATPEQIVELEQILQQCAFDHSGTVESHRRRSKLHLSARRPG